MQMGTCGLHVAMPSERAARWQRAEGARPAASVSVSDATRRRDDERGGQQAGAVRMVNECSPVSPLALPAPDYVCACGPIHDRPYTGLASVPR